MKKIKKQKQIFSSFLNKIRNIIYAKNNWLKKVSALSYKKIGLFYFFCFCVGRILLNFNPIRFDIIHQIVLTIISLMAIYSLKYAYIMTEKIKSVSSGLPPTHTEKGCRFCTMQMIVDEMINIQQSIWWLLIMLIPVVSFIKKNLYLGFVEKEPSGFYALMFASSTYYLALLGYIQIVIALFSFYKISHDFGGCISLDFPSDVITPPEWYSLWNQLFQKIVRIFFCVGTLFTLEYVLLMPENIVTVKNREFIINTCDNRAFLKSWAIIFIFIVIAFPSIAIIIRRMQKALIKNLSEKVNHEYQILFPQIISKGSPTEILAYKQLVETTILFENYFKKGRNIIPVVSTLISFLLNVVKLYESILLPFS